MNPFQSRNATAAAPIPSRQAAVRSGDDETRCGWFASSAELRCGLSVTELLLPPPEFAEMWRRAPACAVTGTSVA